MIYVLAGQYEQARNAMRDVPPGDWRYVSDRRALLGARDGSYVIVGTFWDRPDAPDIFDTLRTTGLAASKPPETEERGDEPYNTSGGHEDWSL